MLAKHKQVARWVTSRNAVMRMASTFKNQQQQQQQQQQGEGGAAPQMQNPNDAINMAEEMRDWNGDDPMNPDSDKQFGE